MSSSDAYDQALEATVSVIDGRWKSLIICRLAREGSPLRFNHLMSKIPGISPRILALHLRQLEQDGVIFRDVISLSPKCVEYSLTEHGEALVPILDQLAEWGMQGTAYDFLLDTKVVRRARDEIKA